MPRLWKTLLSRLNLAMPLIRWPILSVNIYMTHILALRRSGVVRTLNNGTSACYFDNYFFDGFKDDDATAPIRFL
ncbi:hypothetical protein J4210_02125 [Candidatus Woesearchaeota archaeon]|nr:hypothetical protein [Candidatus Woesearchaeota archaeon]